MLSSERAGAAEAADRANVSFTGFLLNDNHFALHKEENELDSHLVKAQTRIRSNLGYQADRLKGYLSIDAWAAGLQRRRSGSEIGDYRLEGESTLQLQEAYLEATFGDMKFKGGQQLFNWGTGDAFHVNNYFDRLDLREMYVVDEDDRYRGTVALAAKYFLHDFAIEAVIAPVFAPPLLPQNNSYWAIQTGDDEVIRYQFKPDNHHRKRASAALRAGGVVGNTDYHFSVFNGVSNTLLFRTSLAGEAVYLLGLDADEFTAIPTTAELQSAMLYERVTTIGFDAASTVGKISYRIEVAYTPDMIAFIRPDMDDIVAAIRSRGVAQLPMLSGDRFAIDSELEKTQREPFASWVIGIDYNYRSANGFILLEWVRAQYLHDRRRFVKPLINDAILLRWADKFWNESLAIEISTVFGPVQRQAGYTFNPRVEWDFKNGVTAAIDLFIFKQSRSVDDLMFELVEEKDVIAASVRYQF
jgi:hypothetical protein